MESDEEFCEGMIMMVWLLTRKQKRSKVNPLKWVQDIFRKRATRGTNNNLIQEMRLNDHDSLFR